MTTLFRARRRAEEFAARVDGTTPAPGVPDSGASVTGDVDHLVGVVQTLRTHAGNDVLARPREAFVADLRERLLAEAETVLSAQNSALTLPTRSRGGRERRLVAVATAAVILGGSAGMAAAAQSALPGEALYPVKRSIEKVEATLSTSSAGRGRDLLDQAGGRLHEVDGLVAEDSATSDPQVPDTLRAFTTEAEEGSDLLLKAYQEDRDPATVTALRQFTRQSVDTLQRLSAAVPAEAQPRLRDAVLALQAIDRRATLACDSCADLPALKIPSAFQVSADVNRALAGVSGPAAGALDNSHPVLVPKSRVGRRTPSQHTGGTVGPLPSAPAVPEVSAPPLPGETGTAPVKVKVKVGDTSIDIGNGLGDLVETLLPDPQQSDGTGLLP